MEMNWLERRYLCERNLTKVSELWDSVSAAIDRVCETFNKHYSETGHAIVHRWDNCSRLMVEIEHQPPKSFVMDMKRRVVIELAYDGAPRITVDVDASPSKIFKIGSDEHHSFIVSGNEITPDEFSKLALQDALFKKEVYRGPISEPRVVVPGRAAPVNDARALILISEGKQPDQQAILRLLRLGLVGVDNIANKIQKVQTHSCLSLA